MRTFQGKHKLKQFMTTKPALKNILEEILHTNKVERWSQIRDLRKEYIL
jgi:hypothetical protein